MLDKATIINAGIAFGSAVAGAFFGSLSAFYLGVLQQKRDKKNKEHAALLEAHFALMSQWNTLANIKKDILDPFRDRPERHLHIPIHYAYGRGALVKISEIAYILCTDPPLLQNISLAEQNYEGAIENLQMRNKMTDEFHAKGKTKAFNPKTGERWLDATHEDVFPVKATTDNLYRAIDSALPKLFNAIQSVGDFTRKNYKGKKALTFNCPPS